MTGSHNKATRTRTRTRVGCHETVKHNLSSSSAMSAVLSAATCALTDVNNSMHLLFIILTSIVHASLYSDESVALVLNNV